MRKVSHTTHAQLILVMWHANLNYFRCGEIWLVACKYIESDRANSRWGQRTPLKALGGWEPGVKSLKVPESFNIICFNATVS